MPTWASLLTKQKTYEITKLLPETEYTVSVNGTCNQPIEVWLTEITMGEDGIIETEVNQNNAFYVADLEYNKLTFTTQNLYTALVIRTLGDLELTTIQLEKGNTPTDWTPAPEDVDAEIERVETVTKASINLLSDEIDLKVDKNGIISAINVSPELIKILAKNIALEGYTSINDHFKVLPNGDVQMVNADVSGKITADSGKIAGFTMVGDSLVSENLTLSPTGTIDLGEVEIMSFYDSVDPNRDALTFNPTREEQHLIVSVGGTTSKKAINSALQVLASNRSSLSVGGSGSQEANFSLNGTERSFFQVTDGLNAIQIGKTNASDPLSLEVGVMKSGDTFYIRKTEIVNGKRRLIYEEE